MKDRRFILTFAYIAGCTAFVFGYILLITLYNVPKDNQQFVHTALGFLLGTVVGGGSAFLVGGTPLSMKKPAPPGNITAEFTASASSPEPENTEP